LADAESSPALLARLGDVWRDPRVAIARREWRVLTAEKTIVLALLIQLFIAAFSSFLVVGLVSLYDPGSVDGYQVDVAVTGDVTQDLLGAVQERTGLNARPYGSLDDARTAFDAGRVDVILAAERRDGRVFVDAVVPDSNVETTVTVVQVREALRAYERAERTDRLAFIERAPLELPPNPPSSPYYGFTYTVLVPLLMFLPVFISGSIAVDSLAEEFERGTLELLRVAPVSMVDIVDGKLLAAAALAPAQAALWLALLELNGTRIGHPALLVTLVAALAVIVVAMAAAVALLAPDRRAGQFLYSIGVLLVFGGTALLPHGPTNTAARLAIDSAALASVAVVLAHVALAVGCVLAVRRLTERIDLDGR